MPVLGPPRASYVNYQPRVWIIGDSTVVGVGAATQPAFRATLYNAFAGLIRMVGSQSYGGTPDILGAQASHEGHSGQTIQQLIDGSIATQTKIQAPDIVQLGPAGINDIELGETPATVLSRMSTALDNLWTLRTSGWMRLFVCPPFKPLDDHDDEVQAVMAGIQAMIDAKSFASRITYVPGLYDSAGADGMNDDHHPNDLGYTRAGAVLATAYEAIVPLARPVA